MAIDSNDYLSTSSTSDQGTAIQSMLDAWGAAGGDLIWRRHTNGGYRCSSNLNTLSTFTAGTRYNMICDRVKVDFTAASTGQIHFYLGGAVSYTSNTFRDNAEKGDTSFFTNASLSGYNGVIITSGDYVATHVGCAGPWYHPYFGTVSYYRGESHVFRTSQNGIVYLNEPLYQSYYRYYTSVWRAKYVQLNVTGGLELEFDDDTGIGLYLHCLYNSTIDSLTVHGARAIGIEGYHLIDTTLSNLTVYDGWANDGGYPLHLHSCRRVRVEGATARDGHHSMTIGGWHFNRNITFKDCYLEQHPDEPNIEAAAFRLHENATDVVLENVTSVGGFEVPGPGVTCYNCTFTSSVGHERQALAINPRMSGGRFIFQNCTFVNNSTGPANTQYNMCYCVSESGPLTIEEISFFNCTFIGGSHVLAILAYEAGGAGPYHIKKLQFVDPIISDISAAPLLIQGNDTTITIDDLIDENGDVWPSANYFDSGVTIVRRS